MPSHEPLEDLAPLSCQRCVERHLKCGRQLPNCHRCTATGEACVKYFKFRHTYKKSVNAEHTWLPLPGEITFLDDSPAVHGGGSIHLGNGDQESEQHTAQRPPIYLQHTVFPLQDESEAQLFRHYIQNLSIWLDLNDPARHFQCIVPQRAGTCPILLNAIFALASRHLSHISNYDPLASNRYHERCLGHLIPMLNHAATISDENLFAATIILRVLEEMEAATIGQDTHGHLLGIHAFVGLGDQIIVSGSLGAACFWVGLRQEIYSAVINRDVVRLNMDRTVVDRSVQVAGDDTWANRAVVHCADVLNSCYATRSPTVQEWKTLWDANLGWLEALPESCKPIYTGEGEETEPFPKVWYLRRCHVIGTQHNLLARMLLLIHEPTGIYFESSRRLSGVSIDAKVVETLQQLCGIGLCNQWTPPSMFTACMGIAVAGGRVKGRRDQEAILAVLAQTEKDHARPTGAVQAQMKQAWGWASH